MGNVSKVLIPVSALLQIGDVGSTPSTDMGYTTEGIEFAVEVDVQDVEVAEEIKPIARYITKETLTMSFTLAETTIEKLALILPGATQNGNDINFNVGTLQECSLCLTWVDSLGATHTHNIVRATPTGSVTRKINRKTGAVTAQVSFKDLYYADGNSSEHHG